MKILKGILTFIFLFLLMPRLVSASTCAEQASNLYREATHQCAGADLTDVSDDDYCLRQVFYGVGFDDIQMCEFDPQRRFCIPRSGAAGVACQRLKEMGGCDGDCPPTGILYQTQEIPQEPAPYVPLPRLQIPLFTLQPFTKPTTTTEGNRTFLNIDFIGTYLAGLYRFLVSIVGVVAGLMIVWSGVKWLTAAGSPDKLGEARRKIADAAVGLILVLGSYVVLQIINPELVFFKPLRVEVIPRIELTLEEQEEEEVTYNGQPVITGAACNSVESCRALCNTPIQTWPTSTATTPDPSTLQRITASPGLDVSACPDGCLGTQALAAALQRAGQTAQTAPGGPYTIKLTSATRTLKKQIQLICNKIKLVDEGQYDPRKLGVALGWPGTKGGHVRGVGVDVALIKDGRVVSCSGCYDSQSQARWGEGAATLANIMFQAGFVRYCKEIWHFELPIDTPDCRSSRIPADQSNVISCAPAVCPR